MLKHTRLSRGSPSIDVQIFRGSCRSMDYWEPRRLLSSQNDAHGV
jgi:hypothetical protein